MGRNGSPRRQATLAALCVMPALLAGAGAAEQVASEPVQAIWKNQEFAFYYQSMTTFYSCSSLEAKLQHILRALGARALVRVRSVDCQSGPVRMPRIIVNVTAPVEATPQALAERDKGKSRRELAARVRGEKEDADALAEFPAQWQHISLSRGDLDLEPGDCELIEQLRRKVLPRLSVRVVRDNTVCAPRQISPGQPQLEVEALVALPKPDTPTSER